MPTKVAHVVLVVRDPHASATLYTGALGMQRVWDFDKLDLGFLSFVKRDHAMALIKAPAGAPLGNQGRFHRPEHDSINQKIIRKRNVYCEHRPHKEEGVNPMGMPDKGLVNGSAQGRGGIFGPALTVRAGTTKQ
jgi:catechol 2,3-dioxygenase-like lactoylglutathione lyase family enzyme